VRERYTDPAGWLLYDDTIPALTELSRRGWRHVVLSNHVPELPAIIKSLGLAPHLAAIVNSASTGYEKPHPQAFRLALAAADRPDRIWMIGDNPTADIAGARAAGIDAILVRTSNPGLRHHAPDLTTVPDLITAADGVAR
jgi:putative hydrolase of the HAD superfamily